MKNQTIQKALENEKNINKAIIADQEQLMNILYILEYKGINVEKIIAEFNENNYDNPNQYKKKIVKAEDDFDVSGSFHSSKFSDMTLSSFYLTEYNYKNIEKEKKIMKIKIIIIIKIIIKIIIMKKKLKKSKLKKLLQEMDLKKII